jgi:transposase InsO family protein
MAYERRFNSKINIKKIKRIKLKFGLTTAIRKRNKYRAGFVKGEEHRVAPNLVQRNFSSNEDVNILSVDISELSYLGGRKAYLFGVKELKSRMIVHHKIKERPSLDLVIDGLDEYLSKIPKDVRKKTIIHSDQGFHFTSLQFRALLCNLEITQSMSRKGNCLDNAPIESFFGHLKDEADYKKCISVEEVNDVVKQYVKYYNNDRPQWSLKRKTPAEAGVELSLVL